MPDDLMNFPTEKTPPHPRDQVPREYERHGAKISLRYEQFGTRPAIIVDLKMPGVFGALSIYECVYEFIDGTDAEAADKIAETLARAELAAEAMAKAREFFKEKMQ